MEFFDFKFLPPFRHHKAARDVVLEAVLEHGPNRFRSAHGVRSHLPVSAVRRSLPRQSLRQRFLLLGSVPLFGFCSADLSRQSPRHRNLPARSTTQALSHGFSRSRFSRDARRCQRESRLAYLPRLCSSADWHGPRAVPRRFFRSRIVRDCLRFRLDHHRFVSVAVSLGPVSPPQECGKVAHAAGRARQRSDQCLCDWGPSPRCQPSGRTASGSRSVLLARSRLCGLRSALCFHASLRLLCHSREKEYAVLPSLLAPGRTLHRIAQRSNHSADRSPNGPALSRSFAAHPLFRRRERLAIDLPDQQFSSPCFDHCPAVPRTLESGIVLPELDMVHSFVCYGISRPSCFESAVAGVAVRFRSAVHRSTSALRMTQGAPAQACVAGNCFNRISRKTVVCVTSRTLHASPTNISLRACRSP